MSNDRSDRAAQGWERVETREAFVASFADRPLYGADVVFTIHSSGALTGTIEGKELSGEWFWSGDLFCRGAWLDGVDLGLDCEVILKRGAEMQYCGDGGAAPPVIVTPQRD